MRGSFRDAGVKKKENFQQWFWVRLVDQVFKLACVKFGFEG